MKSLSANAGDARDARSVPGMGNGNPFQNSCLENPVDRGAQQAIVHGVAKSQARLSDWAGTPFYVLEWLMSGDSPGTEKDSERKRKLNKEPSNCIVVEKSLVSRNNNTVFRINNFFFAKETNNIKMHLPKNVTQQYTRPH